MVKAIPVLVMMAGFLPAITSAQQRITGATLEEILKKANCLDRAEQVLRDNDLTDLRANLPNGREINIASCYGPPKEAPLPAESKTPPTEEPFVPIEAPAGSDPAISDLAIGTGVAVFALIVIGLVALRFFRKSKTREEIPDLSQQSQFVWEIREVESPDSKELP